MKKLTGILLFICLMVPFLGVLSVYHYQRNQVRKEIKWRMIRGVDKDDLVLVKVGLNDVATKLDWKHSREFEYAGHMYDVVEQMTAGDTIFFYCWPDHAETKLNRQLSVLMERAMGQNPQNKAHQQHLSDFFKSLFSSALPDRNQDAGIIAKNIDHPRNLLIYVSLFFPPPSPPPEVG